jgi:hypothetical protein
MRSWTAQAVASLNDQLSKDVPSGSPQPFGVGTNGAMITGLWYRDKSKAITEATVASGRTTVDLTFWSQANDPVPPDVLLDIAANRTPPSRTGCPAR